MFILMGRWDQHANANQLLSQVETNVITWGGEEGEEGGQGRGVGQGRRVDRHKAEKRGKIEKEIRFNIYRSKPSLEIFWNFTRSNPKMRSGTYQYETQTYT